MVLSLTVNQLLELKHFKKYEACKNLHQSSHVRRPVAVSGKMADALVILEAWQNEHYLSGGYLAARETMEKCEELQLCCGIYYANDQSAAYSLGEELACGAPNSVTGRPNSSISLRRRILMQRIELDYRRSVQDSNDPQSSGFLPIRQPPENQPP